VLVQVAEKAVQVPVSALFPIGAKSALFVLEQGHARLREIDVVARNGADAWIKSDLPVGTLVIVYPDRKLKDGDAVKPRRVSNR
jgi:HlyD family secretion protein